MLASLWTGLGSSLAERWMVLVLSPAFVFWGGGILAAGLVDDIGDDLADLSGAEQIAAAVGALLLVAASSAVVQAFTLLVLRVLEGYWPRFADPLRRWLVHRVDERMAPIASRWSDLAVARRKRPLTPAEEDELARLDRERRVVPTRAHLRMPTRLGNVLRVAEARPGERYGLDSVVCWPRLWLVLPEETETEVAAARRVLDQSAEVWLWALLFCLWAPLVWWAPLAGIAVAFGAYRAILVAAGGYGELVVSAFDLHRDALYEAVRWPLPATPENDVAMGLALTSYLDRGLPPRGFPGFTGSGESAP